MHVLIAILLCIVIGPSWAEEAIITDGDTLILMETCIGSMVLTPPRQTRCASTTNAMSGRVALKRVIN